MRKCIAFLVGSLLLCLQPALAGPALTVNRDKVNIRADATVQSQRITVLQRGVEMEELDRKDEWVEVRLPDGRAGWVHSALVQEQLIVAGRGVRVRAAGSTAAPSVTTVSRGEELSKLRQQGSWYEVELPDQRKGWISKNYVRPKEISIAARAVISPVVEQEEEVAVESPPAEEESPPPAAEAEPVAEEEPVRVQESLYAAGLTYEDQGRHRAALERFEQVLGEDPNHVKALSHAARMRRQLRDYDGALADLYRAVEISGGQRDLYLELGDIYHAKGAQDSTRKYMTLYQGGEWTPAPAAPAIEQGDASSSSMLDSENSIVFSEIMPWIYVVAGGGAILALVAMILLLRRDKDKTGTKKRVAPKGDRGKFSQAMQEGEASQRAGRVNPGEEGELDQQIEAKWQELSSSAAEFGAGAGEQGMEEEHMDHVLTHLETLRKALEMQDERAGIYADIVRLQNMKIEAMNDELRLLRRQRKQ